MINKLFHSSLKFKNTHLNLSTQFIQAKTYISKRVYVGNLSLEANEELLANEFKPFKLNNIIMTTDVKNGRERRYAFVDIDYEVTKEFVETFDACVILGRQVTVRCNGFSAPKGLRQNTSEKSVFDENFTQTNKHHTNPKVNDPHPDNSSNNNSQQQQTNTQNSSTNSEQKSNTSA